MASKLLSPNIGMVAGCSLLIDYVLTITISIASGVDAIYSFLPIEWAGTKLIVGIFGVGLLIVLNNEGFFKGMGVYLTNFFPMALYRGEAGMFGDPGWLGWWTVFFWGWFLGYGPLMAVFVARVSRGRIHDDDGRASG